MAQLIVRRLEEEVKARLTRRAERSGHSLEEEVRQILRNVTKAESRGGARVGSRMAARFAKAGLTKDLPELRDQAPRAADFDR